MSFFAATLVLLSLTVDSRAQDARPLALDDCLRLAESAPSNVARAVSGQEIAANGITRARSLFLPSSRLAGAYTYNSPLLDNRELFSFLPLNGIREYATLLTVKQELDTSGRLRAEWTRAAAERQAAEANLTMARRELKRQVAFAYHRLLLARKILETAKETLKESAEFADRTKRLFEGGEAARADSVKASASLVFIEQTVRAAELEVRLANQELASFWTDRVSEPLTLVDILDEPIPISVERTPTDAFRGRPELALLDADIKGLRAEARRAKGEMLPQLNLVFQYGIDSLALRIRDRGYAAFFVLDVPLFDWFGSQAASRAAAIRAEQAETDRAIAERAFASAYEKASAQVTNLVEQVSLTKQQISLAEEDLRLSRVRYNGGEGSAFEVVTAQNQLGQARTNYYTAVANYLNARIDLEVASNR